VLVSNFSVNVCPSLILFSVTVTRFGAESSMYIGQREHYSSERSTERDHRGTTTSRPTRTKHKSISRTLEYQIHNITAKYKHKRRLRVKTSHVIWGGRVFIFIIPCSDSQSHSRFDAVHFNSIKFSNHIPISSSKDSHISQFVIQTTDLITHDMHKLHIRATHHQLYTPTRCDGLDNRANCKWPPCHVTTARCRFLREWV